MLCLDYIPAQYQEIAAFRPFLAAFGMQEPYKPPMPLDIFIPGLKNFQKDAFDLYRSARPSKRNLIKLKENGIDVVINFQHAADPQLPNGPEHLIHIPSREKPGLEQLILPMAKARGF